LGKDRGNIGRRLCSSTAMFSNLPNLQRLGIRLSIDFGKPSTKREHWHFLWIMSIAPNNVKLLTLTVRKFLKTFSESNGSRSWLQVLLSWESLSSFSFKSHGSDAKFPLLYVAPEYWKSGGACLYNSCDIRNVLEIVNEREIQTYCDLAANLLVTGNVVSFISWNSKIKSLQLAPKSPSICIWVVRFFLGRDQRSLVPIASLAMVVGNETLRSFGNKTLRVSIFPSCFVSDSWKTSRI